jgi:hypothetical protein
MSSNKLFQLLASIETVILDYCSNGDIMKTDSFLDILYSLCLEELPQVGCDDHRQEVMVISSMILWSLVSSAWLATLSASL